MTVNNYETFKKAVKSVEEENHKVLLFDIEKVKAFVEKMLTLCLESTANRTATNYPGVSW